MTTEPCAMECYQEALAFVLGRIDYERIASVPYREREYKLDRMRELLARLGNPQQQFPIVHIAGTKGKGSTATMLSSISAASGYRTGLFTSPHLDAIEERIRINGVPCSPDEFAQLVAGIRPVVAEMDREASRAAVDDTEKYACGPTYFELTTALALLHFAQTKVDLGILEVGLGGRLDSTNICDPACTVITSISFDHTRQLGATLAQIAGEKAGIVKPGVPLVSGVLQDEARNVIERIAAERGADVLQLGRDFDYEYRPPQTADLNVKLGELDFWQTETQHKDARRDSGLALGLLGRHQAANAAVSLEVVAQLRKRGFSFDAQDVARGLATASCPARVEVLCRQPFIVVDAAHNVASIQALVETLDDNFGQRPGTLIFASTKDKDIHGMLRLLLPRFEKVVFTRYQNNPRGVSPAELERLAVNITSELPRAQVPQWSSCPNPAAAWASMRDEMTNDALLCVTGSFFIAAEMRKLILDEPHSAAASETRF